MEQVLSDNNLVISVDAMGGDNSPRVVVEGINIAHKSNPDIPFRFHPLDLGCKLRNGQPRRLINIERRLCRPHQSRFQMLPFLILHFLAPLPLVGTQASFRCDETVCQFDAGHLQRKEGRRDIVIDGCTSGHVQRNRRLPMPGTRPDHDEVSFLPPHRDGIEGRES